jgi:FMN phosphatase YigB (HAD superfamily)
MKLEIRLLDLACDLQKKGTSVALVTNNMDIFNEVTIPYHNLDKIFPVIVNSCDHGFLKHEEGGRLFDIALQKLKQDSFKKALLIDDSAKVRKVFEDKGGTTFAYTVYENFEPWARENLCY